MKKDKPRPLGKTGSNPISMVTRSNALPFWVLYQINWRYIIEASSCQPELFSFLYLFLVRFPLSLLFMFRSFFEKVVIWPSNWARSRISNLWWQQGRRGETRRGTRRGKNRRKTTTPRIDRKGKAKEHNKIEKEARERHTPNPPTNQQTQRTCHPSTSASGDSTAY